jgi:hypothetical protein
MKAEARNPQKEFMLKFINIIWLPSCARDNQKGMAPVS